MRKIVFILAIAVLSVAAQAGNYAYLVFTNTAGTHTALTVSNLTMTVNANSLSVTNDEGTVSFTLTELSAMEFSPDGETLPSALENVLNADATVQVFTITGFPLGSFDNLLNAASSLSKGVYVIRQGNNAQKILLQ